MLQEVVDTAWRLLVGIWSVVVFLGENAAIVALISLLIYVLVRLRRVLPLMIEEPVATGMLLGATLIFFLAPQMPDMIVGTRVHIGPDGQATEHLWRALGVPVFAGIAGGIGWFWTRAALLGARRVDDYRRWFAPNPYQPRPEVQTAGRLPLLWAVLLNVAPVAIFQINNYTLDLGQWLVVGGGLVLNLLLFLVIRSPGLRQRIASRKPTPQRWWKSHILSVLAAAPGGWIVGVAVLAVGIAGCVVVVVAPGWIERYLHTPSAALLAIAALIGPLTLSLAAARDLVQALLWLGVKLRRRFRRTATDFAQRRHDVRRRYVFRQVSGWAGFAVTI